MKKLLFIFIIILCGCSKSDTPHKTTESRDASRKAVPPAQKISESPVYETEETLGEAQTPLLDDGINRVLNINLACSHISGTALNPGEEFSFNASVGGENVMVQYLRPSSLNHTYVIYTPEKVFMKDIRRLNTVTMISYMACLLLGAAVIMYISRRTYSPIENLVKLLTGGEPQSGAR